MIQNVIHWVVGVQCKVLVHMMECKMAGMMMILYFLIGMRKAKEVEVCLQDLLRHQPKQILQQLQNFLLLKLFWQWIVLQRWCC